MSKEGQPKTFKEDYEKLKKQFEADPDRAKIREQYQQAELAGENAKKLAAMKKRRAAKNARRNKNVTVVS